MSEIIVDDTDPGIQYSNSGWFEDYGSQDADGNWGPTYNKSLHGTKTNGNFSFSFQGNSVAVYGTNARINTTMGLDPSWECFVNNVNIGASSNVLSPAENNFLLCSQVIMDDGIHQLTVQATSNTGQPFWFDFIRYRPSSTVSEPIASILIQRWDQAINYGAGWSAYGTIANYTSNQGAEFWYNFTGIGINWVGLIPADAQFARNQSMATYSIDNGPFTSFNLNGLPPGPNVATVYEQLFFSVSKLSPGPHSLHVVHHGTPQQTPLTLSYLILTNSTLLSPTSSLTSTPSSLTHTPSSLTSTPSATNPSVTNPISHKSASTGGSPPTDTIVGGVVGGVIVIALTLLFLLLCRRRQKRERASRRVSLATGEVTPFTIHSRYELDPHPTDTPGPSYGTLPLRTPNKGQGISQANIQAVGNHVTPLSNLVHRDSGVISPQRDMLVADSDILPPTYSDT